MIFCQGLKKFTEIAQRGIKRVCVRGIEETRYETRIWHVTI